MEFHNFSKEEIAHFHKALACISPNELDTTRLPDNLAIVQTETYQADCDQFIDPERSIGTEDIDAAVIFPNNRTASPKILLNKEKIVDLSYIHTLSKQLVIVYNFHLFFCDYGHMYTFTQEKMIEKYYYEFLLWVKFQAKKISTRAYVIRMWHKINGEAPPPDNHYFFAGITVNKDALNRKLHNLEQSDHVAAARENVWDCLGALAAYLGELAFYQNTPDPGQVDEDFPGIEIFRWFGEENTLKLYDLLLRLPIFGQARLAAIAPLCGGS
ncbi:MAG: hypothetical protein CSA32_04775 [Desulfobulbus propionicus]|nr:MAG: hypothetical protein CSA32_04775 [Desulfobulbus propionicus]